MYLGEVVMSMGGFQSDLSNPHPVGLLMDPDSTIMVDSIKASAISVHNLAFLEAAPLDQYQTYCVTWPNS